MAAVHVRELDVVRGSTHALRAIVGVQVIRSGTVEVLGLSAGAPELRRRTP